MGKTVVGIIAHVDAGKTTLAEAMLYKSGAIRKTGRVDDGNTALDSHALEKERGITIFAGESHFKLGDIDVTLLDTPGHVDFGSETERILKILDYAILVISGTDGVQAHTRTLWKMLNIYSIPTVIFVTKMDFSRLTQEEILSDLKELCGDRVVNFNEESQDKLFENIAVCREDILESFLETGSVSDETVTELITCGSLIPCFFGSGLKNVGVDEFLDFLKIHLKAKDYPKEFGAKVFKISHDSKGERLTHLKITGGSLKVKDIVTYQGKSEKVNSIRLYNGLKFQISDEETAGGTCVVTGLTSAQCGEGFGYEETATESYLEPVMNYRIVLPKGVDASAFLPKLKELEEEDPQLHITWDSFLQEIHVSLMGNVQTEILKSIIKDRFDTNVEIDSGRVLYKETISNIVEGVGHYEPLRHYAEVHLILEPLPRGSGLKFSTKCGEDILDRNWQNLILMHLAEKEHLGVLTGSPITDIKITLAAGRAHLKHTEGGDFRQSTYRAVRQGLMQAESVLLEPYYSFRLKVPTECIGRAINDIRMKNGTFENPEDLNGFTLLKGKAPVVTMNGYQSEVSSYTGGRGQLNLEVSGYDECHNPQEVIELLKYSPESDVNNSPDSVFCSHGAGFNVKWDEVFNYMHIESCLNQKSNPYEATLNSRNFHIDDRELEEIMNREFGADKHPFYRYTRHVTPKKPVEADYNVELGNKYVIVDGYNVIFAWEELKKIADDNLENARQRLMDILCNYSAFTRCRVVLVFDAYKVKGNKGKKFTYNNIGVVFTKERELGDNYIEKLVSDIGKNDKVRVVTSDNLIQLNSIRFGVSRVSSQDFEKEVNCVDRNINDLLQKINKPRPAKVKDLLDILGVEEFYFNN